MTDETAPGQMDEAPLQIHLEVRVGDTRILCQSHVPQDEWDSRSPDERFFEARKGVLDGIEAIFRQIEEKDLFS